MDGSAPRWGALPTVLTCAGAPPLAGAPCGLLHPSMLSIVNYTLRCGVLQVALPPIGVLCGRLYPLLGCFAGEAGSRTTMVLGCNPTTSYRHDTPALGG